MNSIDLKLKTLHISNSSENSDKNHQINENSNNKSNLKVTIKVPKPSPLQIDAQGFAIPSSRTTAPKNNLTPILKENEGKESILFKC